MVSLEGCGRSSNALGDPSPMKLNLSNGVCVLSETRDLSLEYFNVITRINKSNSFVKHISYDCKMQISF